MHRNGEPRIHDHSLDANSDFCRREDNPKLTQVRDEICVDFVCLTRHQYNKR